MTSTDYALHRMRLQQENKIAQISTHRDLARAVVTLKRAGVLGSVDAQNYKVHQVNDRLPPALRQYYWRKLADIKQKTK